jgi:WS/DGAT/MGAT family acyltransferase
MASELPTFDRTMTDSEGLMWRLEKDPHLSSNFGNVTILDRPPDQDQLLRRLDRAARVVPRLHQRVQPAPANLMAPSWVDDTDFDLHRHVRRVALPKPGSMRQLLDLATLIVNDPFDRTRPLWQFTVVEGLRDDRAALIQKLHHTITDGEGGVALSLQFLDLERHAPEPPPLPSDHDDTVGATGPSPDPAEAMRELLAGSMRMPIGVLRQLRELLADPTQIPGAGAAMAETVRGILTQLAEVDRARSPLWTQRSVGRRLESLRVPFHSTRDAARRLGGTLNTAFLTAAADAAGRYHRELDAPVETLRASMAISTRTASSGANAFNLARMLVPTGDMPVDERFRAIQEATTSAREASTTASLDTLAAVAATLPTSLVTRLVRTQAQTVDFATSNVRAASFPVYVAGARVVENYPIGPLLGVAFNLTLLSYHGSLDMGLNTDTAAVERPAVLAKHLRRAFKDLAKA